jgi:hypothetical protein
MNRTNIAFGIAAAFTVIMVGFYLWLLATPRRWDGPDIAFCRALYAAAGTHADSARVDGSILPNQGKRQASAVNCGGLRAAYPDLFAARASRE